MLCPEQNYATSDAIMQIIAIENGPRFGDNPELAYFVKMLRWHCQCNSLLPWKMRLSRFCTPPPPFVGARVDHLWWLSPQKCKRWCMTSWNRSGGRSFQLQFCALPFRLLMWNFAAGHVRRCSVQIYAFHTITFHIIWWEWHFNGWVAFCKQGAAYSPIFATHVLIYRGWGSSCSVYESSKHLAWWRWRMEENLKKVNWVYTEQRGCNGMYVNNGPESKCMFLGLLKCSAVLMMLNIWEPCN